MLRGNVTLRRHLRQFVDSIGVNWNDVKYEIEYDEEGNLKRNDERLEVSFRTRNDCDVTLAIFAPSIDRDHKPDGKNILPLGKVAVRCGGRIYSGPIDQETWANIRKVINE